MKNIFIAAILLLFSFCQNQREKEFKKVKREFLLCSLISSSVFPNKQESVSGVIYCTIEQVKKIDKINDEDDMIPGLF